jgi:hypothetical protein
MESPLLGRFGKVSGLADRTPLAAISTYFPLLTGRVDPHEARAYHRWEAERQKQHQEYANRKSDERHDYWNWRHAHPD